MNLNLNGTALLGPWLQPCWFPGQHANLSSGLEKKDNKEKEAVCYILS